MTDVHQPRPGSGQLLVLWTATIRVLTDSLYCPVYRLQLFPSILDIPDEAIAAPANRHDAPLLEPTLDALAAVDGPMTVHRDLGYDAGVTRQRLAARGMGAAIAEKGRPVPVTAGQRWAVERTTAWTNAHKTLVWWTERRAAVVAFRIAFSTVIIIVERLVCETWVRSRWDNRPCHRP